MQGLKCVDRVVFYVAMPTTHSAAVGGHLAMETSLSWTLMGIGGK